MRRRIQSVHVTAHRSVTLPFTSVTFHYRDTCRTYYDPRPASMKRVIEWQAAIYADSINAGTMRGKK